MSRPKLLALRNRAFKKINVGGDRFVNCVDALVRFLIGTDWDRY